MMAMTQTISEGRIKLDGLKRAEKCRCCEASHCVRHVKDSSQHEALDQAKLTPTPAVIAAYCRHIAPKTCLCYLVLALLGVEIAPAYVCSKVLALVT